MVALDFLGVLDSEMLLLLAKTNTLLVQRAEAASSALAVDDVVCQSEVEACYDSGETCRTCLGVDDTVKTELAVFCAEGLDSEDSDSSEVTCDNVRSVFCCLDVMTPESACLDDEEFVDCARCFLESWGLLGRRDRVRYVEDAGKRHCGGGTAANLEYRLGCCCV